jgi:hypothetical protein
VQSFYPTIEPSIPQDVQRHLRLIYQKINNHGQAFDYLATNVTPATTKAIATATTASPANPANPGGGGAPTGGVTSFNTFTGNVVYYPGLGVFNDQSGAVTYSTQNIDNGKIIKLNSSAAVAVTLDVSNANTPWFTSISNQGTAPATITPNSGTTVNGFTAITLPPGGLVTIYFDGTNWEANTGGDTVGNVTSLNALTGALALLAGAGISVSPSGSGITLGSTGVLSLNALVGALSLLGGAGITVTPSGSGITLDSTGVLSMNALTGALSLLAGPGISVTPSGSGITLGSTVGSTLFAAGHTGTIPNGTPGLVVAFLTPFPTACTAVVAVDDFGAGASRAISVPSSSVTQTGFTVWATGAGAGGAYWIAMGN